MEPLNFASARTRPLEAVLKLAEQGVVEYQEAVLPQLEIGTWFLGQWVVQELTRQSVVDTLPW